MRRFTQKNFFLKSHYSHFYFLAIRSYTAGVHEFTEFSTFASLMLAAKEKSVFVSDIDNSLIMGVGAKPKDVNHRISGYGSDYWFSAKAAMLAKHQFMMLLAEYYAIQAHIQQTTTEPCIPEKLADIGRKMPVYALSARSDCLSSVTSQTFKELSIGLNDIVYCNGAPKSACFDLFMKKPEKRELFSEVKTVFFWDDKLPHCKDMFNFFQKQGFNAIVGHYTRVEKLLPISSDEEMKRDRDRLIQEHGLSLPHY